MARKALKNKILVTDLEAFQIYHDAFLEKEKHLATFFFKAVMMRHIKEI